MKAVTLPLVAVSIVARPLANEDFLEPSVLNEVEHALSVAPTNVPPPAVAWKPATNGLSRTALALQVPASSHIPHPPASGFLGAGKTLASGRGTCESGHGLVSSLITWANCPHRALDAHEPPIPFCAPGTWRPLDPRAKGRPPALPSPEVRSLPLPLPPCPTLILPPGAD